MYRVTSDHCARELMVQSLEPRVLLSLTYYESQEISELAGFPGGEPGSLAGVSENGRFLWSHGAAEEPYDQDDPAFLVIDRVYRPIAEFPPLVGASVADINSAGTAIASDRATGRAFLFDILGGGERVYLDGLIADAPPEFDLTRTEPVELGDGGIMVLSEARGGGATRIWGLLDGAVQLLWTSTNSVLHVDTTPANEVTGSRYIGHGRTQGVRWSPSGGLGPLSELIYALGVNSRGEILGAVSAPDKPSRMQTVIWRDGVITTVEDTYATGAVGLDDYHNALLVRYESFHSGASWRIPSISRGGVQVELSELGGYGDRPLAMTDSGLVVCAQSIITPVSPEVIAGASEPDTLVTVDASGRLIVVFSNRRGVTSTISLHRGEAHYGEWALQGASPLPESAEAFTSNRDGSARFLLLNSPHVYDTVRHQLLRQAVLEPLVGAATTVYQTTGGLQRIAILELGGDLRLWFQKRGTDWRGDPAIQWQRTNLSTQHLAERGLATPDFASNLDSFATPWGAMNIVGLDADGDLHAVWWSPGLRSPLWTASNLSEITGAPKLVGNITASATRWNGMQVFGTDERGHLIAVWWSPASGRWQWDDLTAEADGETLVAGSITGAATRWGAIEVVGRSSENEVVTYWWAPASGGWQFESITAQQSGEAARIVGPLSMAIGRDGSHHITGVSDDGDVIRLYWLPDGTDLWRGENLTELALS